MKYPVPFNINLDGTRFCNFCHQKKKQDGGEWVKYKNGLYQKWRCGACTTVANQKIIKDNV